MGGGDTEKPEVAKRLRRRRGRTGDGGGGTGGGTRVDAAAGHAEVEESICERRQTVSFRVTTEVAAGTAICVLVGDPPALVADGKTIGFVSDTRQAATLGACIRDGYIVDGEIVAVDGALDAGLASVVGVRSN